MWFRQGLQCPPSRRPTAVGHWVLTRRGRARSHSGVPGGSGCGLRDSQSWRTEDRELICTLTGWRGEAGGRRAPRGYAVTDASQCRTCDQASAVTVTPGHQDRHTRPEPPSAAGPGSCHRVWWAQAAPVDKTDDCPPSHGPWGTPPGRCGCANTRMSRRQGVGRAATCGPLRSPAARGRAGTTPGSRGSRGLRSSPRASQR